MYSSGRTQINPPSRFLSEIPAHLVVEAERARSGFLGSRRKKSLGNFGRGHFSGGSLAASRPAFSKEKSEKKKEDGTDVPILQPDQVRPGDMVEHPQFGSGLIISVEGTLATVAFKQQGVKKMMLGVAPLRHA
ncbi:MAG: hypothetical protein WDN67_02615 [Candidatus Moraniibacteriota bacterium]